MNAFHPFLCAFALLLAAVSAQAAEIRYDYAHIDLLADGEQDVEGLDRLDYGGFGLDASVQFDDRIFGFAGSSSRTVEFSDRDVSSNLFYAGVGVRHGLITSGPSALGLDYRVGDLTGNPDDNPEFDVEEDELRFGARWYY